MLSTTAVLRLLVLLVLQNTIATATADTRLTFPDFTSHDDFFTLGDVAYDSDHRSYIMNRGARTLASRGTCGVLVYGKRVRIQSVATGRVASFSSSFTFTFTKYGVPRDNVSNTLDGSGFNFAMIQYTPMATLQDTFSRYSQFGACKLDRNRNIRAIAPIFAIEFDTDYNPSRDEEPSNSFVRVARNDINEYDIEAYTHNFCGNDTHCSYFSNGKIFTAWVDFTSSSQTLELRIARGSLSKPVQPLLLISNYKFPRWIGDEVVLLFSASSDINNLEEHELVSWSFFSTGISESKRESEQESKRESEFQVMFQYLKTKTWVGGILFGALAALVILWFVFSFASPSSSCTALGYSTGPRVFSYTELRKATDNFDERFVLGSGASGVVYKGTLAGFGGYDIMCFGKPTTTLIYNLTISWTIPRGVHDFIAVKLINMSKSAQAKSLFHAEVASLGQIRHRNVMKLEGWCQEKGKSLLVYEYLSNGTLHDWLYKNHSQKTLSLNTRHSILEGVGVALKYLHEDCSSCILHRDIKSNNVLLDADFNAYIGDFGLARLVDHNKLEKTTLAAGSFGYMAPELPYTGKATKESDVYSFGILVLEVVCGRRPLDLQTVEPEDLILLFAVWRAHEDGSLFNMVDSRMFGKSQPPSNFKHLNNNSNSNSIVENINLEIQKAILLSFFRLGLFCCLPNPKARPSMGEVNRLLQQIRDIENQYSIKSILIPSLPSTKPLGLYHSLEFSYSSIIGTSIVPSPTSLV